MNKKNFALAILIGGLSMGLFSFFNKKFDENLLYRLVWFELQVAPDEYRFAIMPKQPILIGFEGDNGKNGVTMLIRHDNVPEKYEQIVEQIDTLIKKNNILNLSQEKQEFVFKDNYMGEKSIHLRIAYANDIRWAGYYKYEDIPIEVQHLLEDTKTFAKQLMTESSNNKISGDEALDFINPDNNTQKEFPEVIIKIRIKSSGEILLDKQTVSLEELRLTLDNLKNKNGGVWYFREASNTDPSDSTTEIIKSVLDEIAKRELPINLQVEEF